MTPRRRSLVLAPALLVLLFFGRCATPPPPPVLDLAISAGADQNPDQAGHPAPVAVYLYQLAATGTFSTADVFALTDRDKATLGEDELAMDRILLSPGERRAIALALRPGAQFLGVVVLFRDIDHARWRALAPLAASGPTRLALKIAGLAATLTPD